MQEMLHLLKEYYLIESNVEYIVKNQFDQSLPFTLPLKMLKILQIIGVTRII